MNKKFLSIIIPHYREKEKDMFPLLSSINNQVGIDFSELEVIISSDGGAENLDIAFFDLFNFKIKEIKLEVNKGPGVVRQKGLEFATGDYIMFCDADDVLHSVGVLGLFIQEVKTNAPDTISSCWLEELLNPTDGKYIYLTHELENTWMHGKVFRREFLIKNNIHFHDSLRVHEDSYFLSIVSAMAKNRRHIPTITYVWKYHKDSITRRNDASYTYNSIPEFIRACSLAHEEIEKINPNVMEYKIIQFILYNYFSFHSPNWQLPENANYLRDAEKTFVKYIKPYWHYWKNASMQTIEKIYNQERVKNFSEGIESETIWQWIGRIEME